MPEENVDVSEEDMKTALAEQLEVLGLSLEPHHLAHLARSFISSGIEAEEGAEQWAATVLSSSGVSVERLLANLDRRLTEGSTQSCRSPKRRAAPLHFLPQIDNHKDVLTDYLTSEIHSVEDQQEPKNATKVQGNSKSLQPVTYSPTVSQSEKYSSRSNSGDILNSFGSEDKLQKCSWTNILDDTCNIVQVPNHADLILTSKAMYGFELLPNKASMFDNYMKYLSEHVLRKAGIKETVPVMQKSQAPVSITGRIDCDSDGRLNPKSVIVQGNWDQSFGHNISVDLDQSKDYTLFPGQIVAMTGLNVHGDKFVAQEIFIDGSHPKPGRPILDSSINGALQMVIACGPFTTSDSLTFEPLNDLMDYVSKHRPHTLLLIGPFLDTNHPLISKNVIAETFKSFFENLVDKLMTTLSTTSPNTQVMMVASSKDAFHINVYPTPPFHIKKTYPNLTMIPDPCVLNISGVKVAVTATDILMHLSKQEISMPPQSQDKMGRLVTQLIYQQSFYPLSPPDVSLSVDTTLWCDFAALPFTPNVLIVPSDFRYFSKNINGCVAVNPERLTKGSGGGTFARIQINSQDDDENTLCQILRI